MALATKLTQTERALAVSEKVIEKQLLRNYQLSLKEIRGKIALAYEKHGADFVNMQKYSRLANLEKDIGKEIAKLSGKNAVTLKAGMAQQYQEAFYRTAFSVETEAAAKLGFGKLNPKVIARAIENPLDRVGFLQRNRDNQARLARQLKEQLTQGLIQGESYQQTARRIKERMDVGAENVLRIARTENHRCQIQGQLDSYEQAEAAGVEMVRVWVATLDDRTRDDHQQMDGVEANDDNLFPSPVGLIEGPGLSGDPAFDINCRCTVRGEIRGYEPEVRRAREVEGEKGKIAAYKNYNDWKAGRIDK